MARRRRKVRQRSDELSHGQFMELWLGPRSRAGLQHFRDDGDAQDVWRRHRDRILSEHGEAGLQFWAHRRYDLHEPEEKYEVDPALAEHERQWAEIDRLATAAQEVPDVAI
ncbi:MAG TPA: hypothetical protein VM537_08060 [Anaerolineae bacterium]|nr:hypothetical protein [Anaerolineae bacterium]